jgi:UDP-N-acetylglucosamine 1-carboxyvinyltransferase
MQAIVIRGGRPLEGEVVVSGAKNAALPLLFSTLLTRERCVVRNVPDLADVQTALQMLRHLGARVTRSPDGREVVAEGGDIACSEAPYELVKTMRASVLALGPLLARCGQARVSLPGGCAIGARPIDLHLKALERLGAELEVEHGYVLARADRLKGAHVLFDKITVTGTENLLMAACLAEGETVLENAAREPEVGDLAALLRAMGAQIDGDGTSTIRIRGVAHLHGAKHRVISDRIEAGTFMMAAAITGGELELENCDCAHLHAVLHQLEAAGARVEDKGGKCVAVGPGGPALRGADVTTEEYPGFPTDMQAQYMALMTQAEGTSLITESIFENRFLHALELARMGANISVEGRRAVVRGPTPLSGASVLASDLRASASLVLAGLVAQGETVVERVYHIDRGYERIEEKLSAVGARIRRVPA